jgi:hypothetical protein
LIAVRQEWPDLDSDEEAVKNMARGIIVRSLRDLVNYRNHKKPKYKKIYDEVHSWMYLEETDYQDDPLDQLMSFEGICGILGWDPSWLRERAKSLTKADLDRLGRNGHGTGLVR